MLTNNKSKQLMASLFATVYLFVALFSQSFHDHGSGEVFKDFHFTKSEKTFTNSSAVSNYTECLSCHVLHEGKYVNPNSFHFSTYSFLQVHSEIVTTQREAYVESLTSFYLRGPPTNFI